MSRSGTKGSERRYKEEEKKIISKYKDMPGSGARQQFTVVAVTI